MRQVVSSGEAADASGQVIGGGTLDVPAAVPIMAATDLTPVVGSGPASAVASGTPMGSGQAAGQTGTPMAVGSLLFTDGSIGAMPAGTTVGAQTQGAAIQQTVSYAGSGLVFNNTYDGTVSAAYRSAVVAAENFFQSHFTDSVTINISFTTGTGSGWAGQNTTEGFLETLTTLKNALASHETSSDDITAVNSLSGVTDPANGQASYFVSTAEEKALGLSNYTGTDGTVLLNSGLTYFYNGTPIAGEYDAISVLEHEISEVMGRIGQLGNNNWWGLLDLFRYSSPGHRDLGTTTDYFSVDGQTLLTQYDPKGQGDAADWNGLVSVPGGYDSFGSATTGKNGIVTGADLREMDILGWTRVTGPKVASVSTSPVSGDLGPGSTVAITLHFTGAVTVAGGTPTIALNNGGTATYSSGSGTSLLNFTYTVGTLGSNQNTSYLSLAPNAVSLNGATIQDGSGTNADLSGANGAVPGGDIVIDTIQPAIVGLAISPGSGDLGPGSTVTVTLRFNEVVNVAGGTPTIALNNGGTATYTGGSGTSALTFSYTVGPANSGRLTSYLSLAPNAVALNGATIANGAGTTADLSPANGFVPPGDVIIDTIQPAVVGISFSPGSGDLGPGSTVTVTLNFNEAVTVAGGTPSVTFNNGGVATYTSGSGTSALTFSYTVGPANSGHLTSYLSLAPNAVSLSGATIKNGAGTSADFSGANGYVPPGDIIIDTIKPAIVGISLSPGSGDLGPGSTVTVTLRFNEAVTVAGGTPTIALNDGGAASYTGGSGTSALTFTYTVGALGSGQNTTYLSFASSAVSLNGATVTNGAGTTADLGAANGYIPPGDLIIDTVTPAITSITENPSSGTFGPGATIAFTVNFNEAVSVSGGTPSLALNDGGSATYTSGSGTSALTFTYTVGAQGSGQNTAWLSLAANGVNLNGAAIKNGAGTTADLSKANGYVPGGDVVINTNGSMSPVPSAAPSSGTEAVTLGTSASPLDSPAPSAAAPVATSTSAAASSDPQAGDLIRLTQLMATQFGTPAAPITPPPQVLATDSSQLLAHPHA
jgi:hypothetical protein